MKTVSKVTKKVGKPKLDFDLPGEDELNEPPDSFLSYVSLIYGESGIGKTTLLSKFPKAMTLMLEPKRRGIRMRMYEVRYVPMRLMKKACKDGLTPWDEIDAFLKKCIADPTVKTVCVDNVDRAYELCMNSVCFNAGLTHPNQAKDYGATWAIVRETFAEAFDQVIYSGKALVFSSKYNFKEVEKIDGEEEKYDRLQPSCSAGCMKYLMEATDFGIYYGYKHGRRTFTVRSTEDTWTKCGPEGCFHDSDGEPISVLEAGETPDEAYQTLIDGFNNERSDLIREMEAVSIAKKKAKKKVV